MLLGRCYEVNVRHYCSRSSAWSRTLPHWSTQLIPTALITSLHNPEGVCIVDSSLSAQCYGSGSAILSSQFNCRRHSDRSCK